MAPIVHFASSLKKSSESFYTWCNDFGRVWPKAHVSCDMSNAINILENSVPDAGGIPI
ncbi:uncharacterized protein ANIA_11354 [Aspergillus nidulans FGSC A4]|uniref:Uncharacterized protein n=1 Tax=Emericella nidulans (strain FGSC A4 / ATCC 38163 / CBS 112.46 / NRRL 194 / M139) TaxID=227321 RepID=C8VHS4_EMENI|nr:hypothetical protein [Aspergillus nidulans FGSC A4]CBF84342.1 TPA: hypothetical protein ANIA_11354 [Aspergillus nidulans FGSC A4]